MEDADTDDSAAHPNLPEDISNNAAYADHGIDEEPDHELPDAGSECRACHCRVENKTRVRAGIYCEVTVDIVWQVSAQDRPSQPDRNSRTEGETADRRGW